MSFDLAMVLGFVVVSGGMLWLMLFVGRFLRAHKPGDTKQSPYECGEKPFGPAWFNFNARFYVVALVFVVFDVQLALAVPVVVVFRSLLGAESGLVFLALFAYLGVMMLTLAYIWRRGDLAWVLDMAEEARREPGLGAALGAGERPSPVAHAASQKEMV